MPSCPRVVLDTNVVLSSLLFSSGRLAPLRLAWQAGRFEPLVSADTAAELVRVLAYPKFKLNAADREELLADYLPYCRTVRMPAKLPALPDCRDPGDVPFLALALAGKAQCLVSGDRDLLDVRAGFSVAIRTPDEFLSGLEA